VFILLLLAVKYYLLDKPLYCNEKQGYSRDYLVSQESVAFGQLLVAGVVALIGGWSQTFQILVSLMFLDYLSGVLKGFYKGELSSALGYRGLVKKTGYLVIVATFFQVGQYLGASASDAVFVRSLAMNALIINEVLSIAENTRQIGSDEKSTKIPKGLVDVLEKALSDEAVSLFSSRKGEK